MEALEESTSGGAHDAVTFSGKGLNFLNHMFKSGKKRDEEEPEENEEDFEDMELDELEVFCDENDIAAPRRKKGEDDDEYADRLREAIRASDDDEEGKRATKKSMRGHAVTGKTSKEVDDETLEEEEEEDDPGEGEKDTVIANKGKRVNTKDALGKSIRGFDDRRFEKSMDGFEADYHDVLDASDAIGALAKSMRVMAKSTTDGIEELQGNIRLLAKGLEQSLKAQAAMASDLEMVKKQPVGSQGGIYAMAKNTSGGNIKVNFYEVQDALTEAMNHGSEDAMEMLKSLPQIQHDQKALTELVKSLPEDVKRFF